jgi:hypothetical protein
MLYINKLLDDDVNDVTITILFDANKLIITI